MNASENLIHKQLFDNSTILPILKVAWNSKY